MAALPALLPSGNVRYELFDGRLVIMAPPGGFHGLGQAQVVSELVVQGDHAGHGRAYGEVGIVLSRDPDSLYAPDAAFICKSSLPAVFSKEGYLETIPQLIVEVRSKNDSQPEINAKVAYYLAAGVVAVWVLDPVRKTVVEHRAEGTKTFKSGDDLAIADLIPGFTAPVARLFG